MMTDGLHPNVFSGIQNFLDREDSILATYTTTDIDGAARSAAEIITTLLTVIV